MTSSPAPALEPVAADDRAVMDDWYALAVRCTAHDTPALPVLPRRRHAVRLRSSPGFTCRGRLARDGAEVIGSAEVVLPRHDNLHHGFAQVLVAPERRRRGLGTRLLARLTADARGAGRTRLAFQVIEPLGAPGPGGAFLRATGARLGQLDLRRRLVLPAADPQAWHALAASAGRAARSYRIVQWSGPTPVRWCPDMAALLARMSTDAPHGGSTFGPQCWDVARVHDRDAEAAAAGDERVVTAAQAGDGRLVAYTEILVPLHGDGGDGSVARQEDTLVAPEHRGHRLGLRIKLANLDRLGAHTAIRAVDTWNADENRWMIAINDALGFLPIARAGDWELDLTAPGPTGRQAGSTAPISAAASGP